MKKSHVFLISLGILAIAAVAMTAVVMANKVRNEDRFTVSASGTVYAKADIANIQVGLRTKTRKTPAEATTESTDKMNDIIAELKNLGIEEKDIKTFNYSLNPVYNYTNARGQELVGYEVSQTVAVKIRDLSKVGDVIAKTTEKGANQIGNISFTIDDEYELKNQARELAIEKAKEKARLIAEQAGMKLGEIKNIYEISNDFPEVAYNSYSNAKLMIDQEAGGIISPTIQTGQNEIKVEVTVVYEVK